MKSPTRMRYGLVILLFLVALSFSTTIQQLTAHNLEQTTNLSCTPMGNPSICMGKIYVFPEVNHTITTHLPTYLVFAHRVFVNTTVNITRDDHGCETKITKTPIKTKNMFLLSVGGEHVSQNKTVFKLTPLLQKLKLTPLKPVKITIIMKTTITYNITKEQQQYYCEGSKEAGYQCGCSDPFTTSYLDVINLTKNTTLNLTVEHGATHIFISKPIFPTTTSTNHLIKFYVITNAIIKNVSVMNNTKTLINITVDRSKPIWTVKQRPLPRPPVSISLPKMLFNSTNLSAYVYCFTFNRSATKNYTLKMELCDRFGDCWNKTEEVAVLSKPLYFPKSTASFLPSACVVVGLVVAIVIFRFSL